MHACMYIYIYIYIYIYTIFKWCRRPRVEHSFIKPLKTINMPVCLYYGQIKENAWESGGKDPHIPETTLYASMSTASRPGNQSPVLTA
jgi:hypothetical protein